MQSFKYSHSSCNTFRSCPFAFSKIYLDRVDRADNYYGQFGKAMHEVLETYLKGKCDIFELADIYASKYDAITCRIPMGNAGSYFNAGLDFFEHFSLDLSKYEVVAIEERLDFVYKDISIVCIPDLILKDKTTGKYILYDYKTYSVKTEKEAIAKIKKEQCLNQLSLYIWAIWEVKDIAIDNTIIWFLRPNIQIEVPWTQDDIDNTRDEFMNTITQIEQESEWKANNENDFFCNFICSARTVCPFKKELNK